MVNVKEPLTESYFYIMLCLYEGKTHGYGIMLRTDELSKGRVKIGSGTMYGAIHNMIKKNWIEECETDSERKRLYKLTALGMDVILSECTRINELASNMHAVIGGNIL